MSDRDLYYGDDSPYNHGRYASPAPTGSSKNSYFPQPESLAPKAYPGGPYGPYRPAQPEPSESGSLVWLFLGCIMPIVGLLLFVFWAKSHPAAATRARQGAVIGMLIWIGSIMLGIGLVFWNVFRAMN